MPHSMLQVLPVYTQSVVQGCRYTFEGLVPEYPVFKVPFPRLNSYEISQHTYHTNILITCKSTNRKRYPPIMINDIEVHKLLLECNIYTLS